jgi:UDP-galactopyranose mutase
VDRFFPWGDPLEYRSLDFDFQTVIGDRVLPATTVNYPNDNTFTRITEPKSATGQQNAKTALVVEYPMSCGEPYYPVLNKRNREVFARYQAEAKRLESSGIHFVGRLANYKYFNMDQAIRNSLDLFERVKEVR